MNVMTRKQAISEYSAAMAVATERLNANKELIGRLVQMQKSSTYESADWWALQAAVEGIGSTTKQIMMQLEKDRQDLENEIGERMFPSDGGDI